MDFALSEEQTMIYEYGKGLSKTFDRKYWMACAGNAESCFFRVKRSSCAAATITPSLTRQAALSW